MPRGKRRKIEVPRDTQPQFELGDTAEDIERRRERERGERGEGREGGERTGGKGQREDRERGWKRTGKDRKATMNRHRYCFHSIQTEEGANEVNFPE